MSNIYLVSNQLESDISVIERQLHRLTQEARLINNQLNGLIEAVKEARRALQ